MRIIIDARKVPAFSLTILRNKEVIHEETYFSSDKIEIEIEYLKESNLSFVWNFALDKDSKALLKHSDCCPPWNLNAKEPIKTTKSFFDIVFQKMYPNPAEGTFYTQISQIPNEMDSISLAFRGTEFYKPLALLDVKNEEDDKILEISFLRQKNIEEIKRKTKRRQQKYVLFRVVEIVLISVIGVLLEVIYPNKFLIFLLSAFMINEIIDTYKACNYIKGFFEKSNSIKSFKELSNRDIITEEFSDSKGK